MKKVIPLLTAGILLGSSSYIATEADAASLSDIDSSYAKNEIQALVDSEIINGYENGTFKPKGTVSRAEFAKMLALALELPENKQEGSAFNDVPDWASPYVGALVEEGIIEGISNDEFGADLPIERQDIMVMMIRALGLEDYSRFIGLYPEFKDENEMADYAFHKVGWAHYIGLTEGYQGFFRPLESAQRQEAARWIYEIAFNKETYERNALEIAINRAFYTQAEEFKWIDNETVEITFSIMDKKVYHVPELMERVNPSLEFDFYLSSLDGKEWVQYSPLEKEAMITKIIDYWKSDYDYIDVIGNEDELKKAILSGVDAHYERDEEYILYDYIVDVMTDYARKNGYIEFQEIPDGFQVPSLLY
ncbi:S-layer homology domain-containing protein [Rossellomorea aquimaris]|uniref:S-layer homology domain-containing protein n=1 Tax=Rossellomorea aquimaris TaxID=189382 RepID=UPI001CFCB53A|nr:S-layer homology domain-containing protein [Rossellomorea aquimaris]